MSKGGRMKAVWPRGRHLTPAPRAMAPRQAIPQAPRQTPKESRSEMQYLPAIPPATSPQTSYFPEFDLTWEMKEEAEFLSNLMVHGSAAMTLTESGPKTVPMSDLLKAMQDLQDIPRPPAEPLEVSPEQLEALRLLIPEKRNRDLMLTWLVAIWGTPIVMKS